MKDQQQDTKPRVANKTLKMLILINISVHCHQHGKELAVDKMVQLIQLAMPEAFEKNTGSVS